jgi:hypothetical protein
MSSDLLGVRVAILIENYPDRLNRELEQDLSNMDQHLNNLRRSAVLETHHFTRRIAMENVILTDQLKEYLSKWTQPQTQENKSRLEVPTGKNPGNGHPWHVDVEIVPDGFQSNSQPAPANRDDVNVLQDHPDGYVTYITAPLIGYLEHRRKFLSEGTSHEFINLFDRPKVASWTASNTSSFLWIEGYPTGAPLNFTKAVIQPKRRYSSHSCGWLDRSAHTSSYQVLVRRLWSSKTLLTCKAKRLLPCFVSV